MHLQLNSIKLLLLVVSWLFIQSTALQHELSSEHLSSNNHICLSQAVHIDDILFGTDNQNLISLDNSSFVIDTKLPSLVNLLPQNNHPARAPPHKTNV